MLKLRVLKAALVGGASVMALVSPAAAKVFDIPDGDLATALASYMQQSDVRLIYMDDVRGHKSGGAKGDYTDIAALTQLLRGTGFTPQPVSSGAFNIVPQQQKPAEKVAQAAPRGVPAAPPQQTGLETVVVTAQKRSEDIQTVPIAVTALSQQQLTERQIAGGPDLVKEVPNLTFSKTNFSGYNLEIRGIGTQAISVTTDPAVAVAFNDIPFIRNHFFEQEFYDLDDAEVLRGPQGTLFGRNATAGVVNLKSALPTDQYEAMLSADMGNYSNRRLEAMLNIPIVGDTLDIRIAGEWTKRDGYTEDTTTDSPVDGRDLWSGRMTIGWKPASNVQTEFVWEHFSEDDDRLRSGKQLCKTDYGPGSILGVPKPAGVNPTGLGGGGYGEPGDYFTQGCLSDVSLYSPQAYEAPLGFALPYVLALSDLGGALPINPYAGVTQSTNLRDIESAILPHYLAKNDTLEFNANWTISPVLTFTSQTGYNNDFLWSSEDYNRFGSNPGLYAFTGPASPSNIPDPSGLQICVDGSGCSGGVQFGTPCLTTGSTFAGGCQLARLDCDPQLGCSDRLLAEDLSTERAWQFSQEFRLSSNFSGPFNFTAGGNYLHYETVEKYYVLSNTLTSINGSGMPLGYQYNLTYLPANPGSGYLDTNPLTNLNDLGHNYFLSQNPYVLNSYAVFGDANYALTSNLKLIAGLRWTDDQKHFLDIPSELVSSGYGYPVTGIIDQSWQRFTGRAVANWTPELDFTDQTLIYGSYAHGYKAGGANPPGALFFGETSSILSLGAGNVGTPVDPVHPLTFRPEYIEAFELGTKNTLLGGALTLNGDVFYYNYTGYQISEIVDRTAINTNYNAHVEGAELESNWEPIPGLKFGFTGGFENSGIAGGTEAVDLMDRTAGTPGWYVVKPFVTEASNCIFPAYVAKYIETGSPVIGANAASYCDAAYLLHLDPLTGLPYVANPTVASIAGVSEAVPPGYPGFDPLAGTPGDPYHGQNTYNGIDYGPVQNNGAGFSKNLSGHQLPNAPHLTTALTAEYTMPVSEDWAATLHTDFYWQSQQWARVFDDPIDKIHGYSNVNVSLILTSANGWQVMGYVKNVFNVTAITGTFLNSDDSGLTTNVFLTDPRLFGVRVTKHLDDNDGFWGSDFSGKDFFTNLFSDPDNGKPWLWIEVGGNFETLNDGQQAYVAPFFPLVTKNLTSPVPFEHPPHSGLDYEAKITFEPDNSDWIYTASVRYGRSSLKNHNHLQTPGLGTIPVSFFGFQRDVQPAYARYLDAFNSSREEHAIFDFAVGKDVGLGMFGLAGTSDVSGGLRFVQFSQSSAFQIHSDPDYTFRTLGPKYNHNYSGAMRAKRSFHGLGPSVSWNASTPVADSTNTGGIDLDWGLNGAFLIGRQAARTHHQTSGMYRCRPAVAGGCHISGPLVNGTQYQTHYQRAAITSSRRRMVAVPNIGAFAGVSWRYQNAKVSFGYRADEFFGAMDGGIDTRKSENVGFFGPFANITIGFGG